jgi:dTDP-glucose 4,6-dehydratase
MDACLHFGTGRFHQISTDEVYGDLPLDSGVPFTESSTINPSSPYSASKASADMLVKSYVRTFGLDATITRCANNYGMYQYKEKLIPNVIGKAMRGESVSLYGDGKNVRDWISVIDHCKAVDAVINHGKAGEIYNVGANNEISNLELVRKILSIMGKSESLIQYVADRAGHDRRYALNCDKIKNELGWRPEVDFDTGIYETVRYYMNK